MAEVARVPAVIEGARNPAVSKSETEKLESRCDAATKLGPTTGKKTLVMR